jgi:hypothetical protein
VAFDDCWPKRVVVDIGGISPGFIAAEDLIADKRASGRPQDFVDADTLARRIDP